MRGDFTRDTYNPAKHFTRVLMQQGRVQIEADWNEQISIFMHYIQTLAGDLIGPHAGPAESLGFGIYSLKNLASYSDLTEEQKTALQEAWNTKPNNFLISKGRYYVDGVLVESDYHHVFNQAIGDFKVQPFYPDVAALEKAGNYLAYLEVWERHITAAEDNQIREVALGGADTATRTKLVWQVRAATPTGEDGQALLKELADLDKILTKSPPATREQIDASRLKVTSLFKDWLGKQSQVSTARLKARVRANSTELDPCIIPPEARYRGAENQLYRVEVHTGGSAEEATFKWSRDNGSVIFPIMTGRSRGAEVLLSAMGRDARLALAVGDWVEILNDDLTILNENDPTPNSLLQVTAADQDRVTLSAPLPTLSGKTAFLRRWDHKGGKASEGGLTLKDGTAVIKESEGDIWLKLEDGIEIQFQPAAQGEKSYYRAGDYWLIPARTATRNVEWPEESENVPAALLARQNRHYVAPLAFIKANNDITDLRRTL